MKSKLNFDIPIIYNEESISNIIAYEFGIQFYGCYGDSFPTGRPNDAEKVEIDKFTSILNHIRNKKFEFNYLLNGNLSTLKVSSFRDYFIWAIHELEPDIVTFSDPIVYHYLVKELKFKKFEISAIAGIRNKADFERFIFKNQISLDHIKKVVLHHDFLGNSVSNLQFVDYLNERNISPRILITESCYYKCPFRKSHYSSLVKSYTNLDKVFVDYFQIDCIKKRLKYPESLLDLSGFLLPEQLDFYSKTVGIDNFKISGRSKSATWIYNTTKAYLSGKSPENIFDIIVFTSPLLSEFKMEVNDLFYLNSKIYYDIYLEIAKISDINARSAFLKQQSVSLFTDGHFKINDPKSIYDVKNGELVLIQKGDYLNLLEKVTSEYFTSLNVEV
jgi:hypothetical protein